MQRLILIFFMIGNISSALGEESPVIVDSIDSDCSVILQNDDFFEIDDKTENLKFDWSGECKDGFANGDGKFTLYSGDYILDIQDFGKNQGVEFDGGVIYKSNFEFFEITEREVFNVGPGLLSCSANTAQMFGIFFKNNVNIDSKKFLIEFSKWFEESINKMCRLTSGQNAVFDVNLNSGGLCNNSGHCSGHYQIRVRFSLVVGNSGYAKLNFVDAFASNGQKITSRYNNEIYNSNLSARRNEYESNLSKKVEKEKSQKLSKEEKTKNDRAKKKRDLIKKAKKENNNIKPKINNEHCIPIPEEYEIVYEVTEGDFRSSGNFYDLMSCEREKEKSFKNKNADCMQFLDARAKISPETKSTMEKHKRRGKMCL